jgi:hypothetical protein
MSLTLWTVYVSPRDYPGKFVARAFELDRPTDRVLVADSLADIRELLPPGLTRLARATGDDPVIVETWL